MLFVATFTIHKMAIRRRCFVLSSAALKSFRSKGASERGLQVLAKAQEGNWSQCTAVRRLTTVAETSTDSEDDNKGLRLSDSCVKVC